uniref:TMEM9 n=1 Tax=virus sp. ctML55 TaxID=2827627 RepID=A0A8S5RIS5_9VIRU|nr:MAG TPA: TMEM9 [virus sp. ctML55]
MNYVSNISTSYILICLLSLSITYLIILMLLDLSN